MRPINDRRCAANNLPFSAISLAERLGKCRILGGNPGMRAATHEWGWAATTIEIRTGGLRESIDLIAKSLFTLAACE